MPRFLLKKDPYREREIKKYGKPVPSREYIIECLDKLKLAVSHDDLIKAFGLRSEIVKEALRRRLISMANDGQLITNRHGNFLLVDKKTLVRGTVAGYKDGYGFLLPEDGREDIFLSPKQMRLQAS